jgi:hypothetical protein
VCVKGRRGSSQRTSGRYQTNRAIQKEDSLISKRKTNLLNIYYVSDPMLGIQTIKINKTCP